MDSLYHDDLLDRYRHPTNAAWNGQGILGLLRREYVTHNPSCGDRFVVEIFLDGDVISAAHWKGEGCVLSTVAIDSLCEWIVGKPAEDLSLLDANTIENLTGIMNVTPARKKCLYLPLSLQKQSAPVEQL